jgi:diacylglycerol kinase (ATP)
MEVDGEESGQRIMTLAVCNGPSVGGSFRICPDARADDGLLDVCVIAELPVLRNLVMSARVLRGTHAGRPGVTMRRGRRVTVRAEDGAPLPFQLDGELREAEDDIHVSLAKRKLNVIRRAGARAATEQAA